MEQATLNLMRFNTVPLTTFSSDIQKQRHLETLYNLTFVELTTSLFMMVFLLGLQTLYLFQTQRLKKMFFGTTMTI